MSVEEMIEANRLLREAVETRLCSGGAADAATETPFFPTPEDIEAEEEEYEYPLLAGSVAFMGVLNEIRQMHLTKTRDYGDSQAGDALANIRHGAEVVGIEPWRAALVRMADKVQRIKTYCRGGTLACEGVEDSFLDLAAYAVIALVLFREGRETNSP